MGEPIKGVKIDAEITVVTKKRQTCDVLVKLQSKLGIFLIRVAPMKAPKVSAVAMDKVVITDGSEGLKLKMRDARNTAQIVFFCSSRSPAVAIPMGGQMTAAKPLPGLILLLIVAVTQKVKKVKKGVNRSKFSTFSVLIY